MAAAVWMLRATTTMAAMATPVCQHRSRTSFPKTHVIGGVVCGRYALYSMAAALQALFGTSDEPSWPPRYNVAPTQPAPVVVQDTAATGEAPARRFETMGWGFVPRWAADPGRLPLIINARAEEALERPAFRDAIRQTRCLVPADGFYEWCSGGPRDKRPMFIQRRDGEPMALAGLYARTSGRTRADTAGTFAIVTTGANDDVSGLHDRMPLVLERDDWGAWLDAPGTNDRDVSALMTQPAVGTLTYHEVGTRVNRADEEGPDLIAPTRQQRLF